MSMNGSIKFEDAAGKVRIVSDKYPLPTAATGAPGSTPLTDTELRAKPVATAPKMAAGGQDRLAITAAADAVLPSNACSQCTIVNRSNMDLVVLQGGKELDVLGRSYFTFFGITNTNQLTIKKVAEDDSITFRWER